MNNTRIIIERSKLASLISSHGVRYERIDRTAGPVTTYSIRLSVGEKVSRLLSLRDDIACEMGRSRIYTTPGSGVVSIEVENNEREIHPLILPSGASGGLMVSLGVFPTGEHKEIDISKAPHLLLAGQTGAGKSVGMNNIILSLISSHSSDDMKIIMIDPKRVELSPYNGIPHLLTPVIFDPHKAVEALERACSEMESRYSTIESSRKRSIREMGGIPSIIIIIDELADLMMSKHKKEAEGYICRLTQMGRAAGIHLIIATQRPSVDVITGVIKSNIPTRIAFTCTSGIDSRTIIDQMGAEDLTGMGDMLLSSPRGIERIQGYYSSLDDIDAMTARWEYYIPSPLGGIDLSERAKQICISHGKGSTTLLQKEMGIGYPKASRLMKDLISSGVVDPIAPSGGARKIRLS